MRWRVEDELVERWRGGVWREMKEKVRPSMLLLMMVLVKVFELLQPFLLSLLLLLKEMQKKEHLDGLLQQMDLQPFLPSLLLLVKGMQKKKHLDGLLHSTTRWPRFLMLFWSCQPPLLCALPEGETREMKGDEGR